MSKLPHPKSHRPEAGLESPPGPLTAPEMTDGLSKLRTVSLRSLHTSPRSFCQWHSHPFDELCLTTDGSTLIGHAGRLVPAAANTLFHYRPGEEHAFWNYERQQPRIGWFILPWIPSCPRHCQSSAGPIRGCALARSRSPKWNFQMAVHAALG